MVSRGITCPSAAQYPLHRTHVFWTHARERKLLLNSYSEDSANFSSGPSTFNSTRYTLHLYMAWISRGKKAHNRSTAVRNYVLRNNRFCTVSPKLPPVIGVPRSCCGHASGISLPCPPWFAVCAPHATPCSMPRHSYCTLCCLESFTSEILARVFLFACFAGCFRLIWSNGNKKYEQQPTKNTPRGEPTFYLLDYSLNIHWQESYYEDSGSTKS